MNGTINHRKLKINGIRFHIAQSVPSGTRTLRAGTPSVLCLHGFPEGWMSWRPLMQQLPGVAIYAPDLRGYPRTDKPADGYDVATLVADIRGLIERLELDKPILLGHDWGGALAWTFAHTHSDMISQVAVVNCTHPKTLVKAVLKFQDFQTFRIPWVPPFQVPRVPEYLLTTRLGRRLLRLSFTLREGNNSHIDRVLLQKILNRFERSDDLRGPINYYREVVRALLWPSSRRELAALFDQPISVPATLVWGLEDRALSAEVALRSSEDAGIDVDWRPLEGVGHFVPLEAADLLADEVKRLLGAAEAAASEPARQAAAS